jgi:hypothetical protein
MSQPTKQDLDEFNLAAHRVVDVITLCQEFTNGYVVMVTRQEMKSIAKVTGTYGELFGKTLEIGEIQTPEWIAKERKEQAELGLRCVPILDYVLDQNTKHDINRVSKADVETRTVYLSQEDFDTISHILYQGDQLYGMRVKVQREKVAA